VTPMHKTLTKLNRKKGMSLNMLKVLAALNELGPLNVFNIHAETGIAERTVGTIRARAVNLGFIQRTEFSDRRQCVYELAPTIKALFC